MLGLVEVEVVAQREHLALPLGQLLQRVEHHRAALARPASDASAPGTSARRLLGVAGLRRRGAGAPTGTG